MLTHHRRSSSFFLVRNTSCAHASATALAKGNPAEGLKGHGEVRKVRTAATSAPQFRSCVELACSTEVLNE